MGSETPQRRPEIQDFVDALTRSVSIATRASGSSWDGTFILQVLQVLPADGGAVVRIGGAAKVGTNFTAKGAENNNTIRLLDETSTVLQGR